MKRQSRGRPGFSLKLRLIWWLVPVLAAGSVLGLWNASALLLRQTTQAYDRSLAAVVRAIDLNISSQSGGLALAQPYQLLTFFDLTAGGTVYYRVLTEGGLAEIGYGGLPLPQEMPPPGQLLFYDAHYLDAEPIRVALLMRPLEPPLPVQGGGRVIVQVAEPLLQRERHIRAVLWQALGRDAVVTALLVAALLLGVMVSLRPLARLRREMEARRPDDLRPVALEGIPAEVAPLVGEINRHMARVADHAKRQRQFLDDASHQLRTPLATLRISLDFAMRESDPQELALVLAGMRQGLDRAERVTNQMLALGRAHDASPGDFEQAGRFDLSALLEESVRMLLPAARARRLDYGLDVPPEPLMLDGRRLLLQEAILNVLDNAIKYSPRGGTVLASLEVHGGQLHLVVQDAGPGMSEQELREAGRRFRRGAAGNGSSGAGLGLAIVETIVRLHGGEMRLQSPADMPGLRVELVFFPARQTRRDGPFGQK